MKVHILSQGLFLIAAAGKESAEVQLLFLDPAGHINADHGGIEPHAPNLGQIGSDAEGPRFLPSPLDLATQRLDLELLDTKGPVEMPHWEEFVHLETVSSTPTLRLREVCDGATALTTCMLTAGNPMGGQPMDPMDPMPPQALIRNRLTLRGGRLDPYEFTVLGGPTRDPKAPGAMNGLSYEFRPFGNEPAMGNPRQVTFNSVIFTAEASGSTVRLRAGAEILTFEAQPNPLDGLDDIQGPGPSVYLWLGNTPVGEVREKMFDRHFELGYALATPDLTSLPIPYLQPVVTPGEYPPYARCIPAVISSGGGA